MLNPVPIQSRGLQETSWWPLAPVQVAALELAHNHIFQLSSGQPPGVPAGHGPPVRSPSELLGMRALPRQKKPGLQSPEGLVRPGESQ